MKLFSNSSGRDASGRTDLPSRLVEMATRSVGRSETVMELGLAWTVETRPYVSATRGLARWFGTTDKVVRETVGQNGSTSKYGFLWTKTRGVASPTAEEREQMVIRYSSNARTLDRSTSLKYFSPSPGQEGVGPLGDLALKEGKEKGSKSNAVKSARISERAQEALVKGLETLSELDEISTMGKGQTLLMLDPGLDIWAEVQGDEHRVAVPPLGRRSWHLAVLTGLNDVTLSVLDIEGLLGLSKRGVQVLLARMEKANPVLVQKVRQGRTFLYEIRFASVLRAGGDYWDDAYDRDNIRKARAAKDRAVQEVSARRGTGPGYIAYLLSTANPKRAEYLEANPLPADADPAWVALVQEGDELALYAHLRQQEAEAGPVPSSPEFLPTPVKTQVAEVATPGKPRPAQESSESAEVSPELLAEMRQRISARTYA
ncbi:hypothetical protein [Streptomyces avermitilis]|uniref:hypothetical protein n=1 Tax=Streptomyces avermitilis TaxID=33903 RepID=UPI0037225C03